MRKRSKYRPRPLIPDPLSWVLNGFKPVREQDGATTLQIKTHAALVDVTQGRGTRQQVDVLIAAMNVAEALYRVNSALGEQYASDIREAQDALYAMSVRGLSRQRFVFTGPELQAMNTGMDIHDAQLNACTIAELEKALLLVQAEIKARKARVIA